MSQHELQLDATRPLRGALDAAFRDIVGFAREMVALAGEDPERAVHDYRRSLRRARSMVALTSPVLSARAHRWVASSLKAAFRDTGELRDHGVLLPVLDEVAPALSEPALVEQLRARLAAERGIAVAAPRVERILRERERELAGLEDAYAAHLEDEVEPEALLESARASFAFTRDAYRKVRKTRRTKHLHDWRKAVKALRYQLELLASGGDPGYVNAHAGALEQASHLGEVTDAMALRDFVKELRKELDGVDAKRALAELARVISARTDAVIKDSKAYYEVKRKRFARAPEAEAEPASEEKPSKKAARAAKKAKKQDAPSGDEKADSLEKPEKTTKTKKAAKKKAAKPKKAAKAEKAEKAEKADEPTKAAKPKKAAKTDKATKTEKADEPKKREPAEAEAAKQAEPKVDEPKKVEASEQAEPAAPEPKEADGPAEVEPAPPEPKKAAEPAKKAAEAPAEAEEPDKAAEAPEKAEEPETAAEAPKKAAEAAKQAEEPKKAAEAAEESTPAVDAPAPADAPTPAAAAAPPTEAPAPARVDATEGSEPTPLSLDLEAPPPASPAPSRKRTRRRRTSKPASEG